jgi:hypothetical protein
LGVVFVLFVDEKEIAVHLGQVLKRVRCDDIELYFNGDATEINVRASWLAGSVVVGDAIVVPGGIKSKYAFFCIYTFLRLSTINT